MSLGENIKKLRIYRGLKQSELADMANISRISVGNYERDERNPSADITTRIAKALGVNIDDLIWSNADDIIDELSNSLVQYNVNENINMRTSKIHSIFEAQLSLLGYKLDTVPYLEAYYITDNEGNKIQFNLGEIEKLEEENLSYLKYKFDELLKKHKQENKMSKK
ncbi:helix-turn-helix domain-containing protein [Anaerosporobacter faecicola]|uniref:helix-turn-helix domain-containing protein n=1 Tax=Anaerosporobacter faecicola TaxID=2718714 RepID=UPI00143A123B|nr:helix-turn-helix transcriptional regulator [Anaerosporobacter faecicola]